ncbi:hypothetical protein [Enterococcus rivorum]|uniref:LXG domain-containing protein n=1 Tax=Enterococcus rivorum TaxID=762845 RepID=A0A1E5KUD2_9ENTE|nr:hypothetical protein [Enterococcus rivorum]MBP2099840.1 hypothetical protein [Enterococcus rivorum]OEH81505.1 hypothetical protein BCR26_04490 [Enterococcus rivorum]
MSIDMYLGQARSQAASVKSVCNQLSQGYRSLLQSNQQFIGTVELSSKAYDSAKAFFSAVIQPLVQGAEVGAEMTAEACQKFVDQYTSEVDSIDLKSDQLERRIQQVNQSIQNMQHINNNLPSLPLGTNPLKQINQRIIESLETTKRDLEKKLEKLLAFNASSPAIFSEVNAFYGTLAQGLQQANTSFNPSTGTFSIPKGKALDWTKSVNERFVKNEIDKLMKKTKLTKDDLVKLIQIAEQNPNQEMPKSFWDIVSKSWNDISENVKDGTPLDFAALMLETSGNVTLKLGGWYNYITGIKGTNFVIVNPRVAAVTSKMFSQGNLLIGGAKYGLPALGGVLDFVGQVSEGEDVGDAAVKAVAHVGIGLASGKAGAAVGAAIGTAIPIPVVGTVAGAVVGFAAGVVIGAVGSWAFDSLYDNKEKIWEGAKELGGSIKNGVEKIGENIGQAVGGFFGNLGSAFG